MFSELGSALGDLSIDRLNRLIEVLRIELVEEIQMQLGQLGRDIAEILPAELIAAACLGPGR